MIFNFFYLVYKLTLSQKNLFYIFIKNYKEICPKTKALSLTFSRKKM